LSFSNHDECAPGPSLSGTGDCNQITQTDGNNNTTQFEYDARKRLIKTINPDKTTIVNTYDGPGNLASVTDQAGAIVQYTYDAGVPVDRSSSMGWDAANQLKTVIQLNHPDPSHNTNLYGYDPLGKRYCMNIYFQNLAVNYPVNMQISPIE
jgi:YD repeat-containing protein